jgi:hypothetical protein
VASSARTTRTMRARGQLSRHHSDCVHVLTKRTGAADLALGFPEGSGGGGWPHGRSSLIGRTSMLPRRANGIFAATWMVSFRSPASIGSRPDLAEHRHRVAPVRARTERRPHRRDLFHSSASPLFSMSRHGPLVHPRSMKIGYYAPAAARATSKHLGTGWVRDESDVGAFGTPHCCA